MESWVWDESEECRHSLLRYDLYVSNHSDTPHLCEAYGLAAYADYGEIHPGDIITLDGEKVYITPFRSH